MTPNNVETPTSWDELPATITNYLTAHRDRDVRAAIEAFTPDAVVTDEGHNYRGRDRIRDWLVSAGAEYRYTTEFISATTSGAAHVDVLAHLEGDFPGGTADLRFRFTMDGALISRLVIEP